VVATISRLLEIIGLFCKRDLLKRLYSAKETYNFTEPTNRSHPIVYKRDFLTLHLPKTIFGQFQNNFVGLFSCMQVSFDILNRSSDHFLSIL